MEETKKMKSLLDVWATLSERGRVCLLAYGNGLSDMENLTSTGEQHAKAENTETEKKKGGK